MIKRTTFLGGILVFGLAFAAQESFTTLKSPRGEFEIRNWSSIVFESGLPGVGKFTADGKPLKMSSKERGLSTTSAHADAETGQDPAGDYFLKSANLTGNAVVTIDSEQAYAFKVELANSQKVAPPPSSPNRSHFTLLSEVIHLTGNLVTGTATLANAFTGAWTRHGTEKVDIEDKDGKKIGEQLRVFDDTAEAHGSNGTLEFFTSASGDTNPIRKGSVLGAATFSFTRKSTLDGIREPDTTFTGGADRIEVDFTGDEHTITLDGSVHMTGNRAGYVFTTSASKAVLVFGPDDTLKQIRMDGLPTQTNIKTPPPSPGGRTH